jgi:hypothetical protein
MATLEKPDLQKLDNLRITTLRVGLVINFKFPKLEWERLVL